MFIENKCRIFDLHGHDVLSRVLYNSHTNAVSLRQASVITTYNVVSDAVPARFVALRAAHY